MNKNPNASRQQSILRWIYLDLTVIGAAIPLYYFVQHFSELGFSLSLLLAQAFANPVATALTSDLLISSFVFWIFAGVQLHAKGQVKSLAIFILLNLMIGLSCALPAYLWWSTRQQQA